jgi:GT2 family glycosyltransferase
VLSVQYAIKNLDAEIIVVDNNSPDDSCDMMKLRFPEIQLIKNQENSGFPKGNNMGVAAAKGKYICILNPDTVVAEDTFTKVIARHEAIFTNCGIVGCKLIDGTGNFLPESKRGIPTPFVAFTKIFGLYSVSNYFGKYYAQHLNSNQSGNVEILVGAFMVMTRELYNEVGGFDENCFMYSDDIDLSYMVLKKGFQNYYYADSSVIHFKGESTVKDHTYMTRFQQAMDFFYKKHFKKSVFFSVFMKIGIVVFSIIKKRQGKPQNTVSPKHYFFISNNSSLKDILEKNLKKPIQIVQITPAILGSKQIEIIFDNNFLSFQNIINQMEVFKKPNITFKILPKNSNFIIGSNSSNERGEVIVFDL